MNQSPDPQSLNSPCPGSCQNRRAFLSTAGTLTTMLLSDVFPNRVFGQPPSQPVSVATSPRQKIGMISELAGLSSVAFAYPDEGDLHNCVLIRTGETSGGGIGPDQDIVAFSARCTHLGGSLDGTYQGQFNVLGPCPLHLTTYDVTRHGMVVAGHATQALPQIILEAEGDEIYAVGVAGLIYGYAASDSV